MKPVPLVLLIATVLLTSHVPPSACRPRNLNSFDGHGYKTQMDEVLLKAGDNAISYLIREKILRYLQRNPRFQKGISQFPLDNLQVMTPLSHLARSLPLAVDERSLEEGNSLEDLAELSKRNDDPPISIDLTFHLLRNMIEMARIESQKEQAELNRKYLDEVGKWSLSLISQKNKTNKNKWIALALPDPWNSFTLIRTTANYIYHSTKKVFRPKGSNTVCRKLQWRHYRPRLPPLLLMVDTFIEETSLYIYEPWT